MNKMEELMSMAKITEFLKRQEDCDKKKKVLWIVAIIGVVAAIAVAA